jgi:glycosyltransferase involved in cell wall biosynthesis
MVMGRRPRVLYVVHDFPPEFTAGTELHTLWLARELSRDFEIYLFTRTSNPNLSDYEVRDERVSGLRIRRVKVSGRHWVNPADQYVNFRIDEKFAAYMDEVHPALVHVQHTFGLSAGIIEVAKSRHVPVLLQIRDFYYMCDRIHLLTISNQLCEGPEGGRKCANCIKANSGVYAPEWLVGLYSPTFEQAGVDRTEYMQKLLILPDLIACPSRFVKEKFVEFRVPARKIIVSPEGVRVRTMQRRKPQPENGKVVFGFLGNVGYHKGVGTLIDAFRTLDQSRAELRLYGGGDPVQTEEYRSAGQNLNVKFFGHYSHEDLPEILSNVDVLVHPSLCHESFSLVIREAFAAGIPVIVSNIRAQADAVVNGRDGLHFQAGDAKDLAAKMNQFLEKPNLAGELARRIPRVRTVEDQAREFARLYRKLMVRRKEREFEKALLAELTILRERIVTRNLADVLRPRLDQEIARERSEKLQLANQLNQEIARERSEKLQLANQLTSEKLQLENELTSARAGLVELEDIRHSFGYKFMRFWAVRMDRLFPDGTYRGTFRKKVVAGLRTATERHQGSP